MKGVNDVNEIPIPVIEGNSESLVVRSKAGDGYKVRGSPQPANGVLTNLPFTVTH